MFPINVNFAVHVNIIATIVEVKQNNE